MSTTRDVLIDIVKNINQLAKRVRKLEVTAYKPGRVRACRVYKSSAFSHDTSNSNLAIPFDSERWDATGMHDTLANSERITFNVSGWYTLGGSISFEFNNTGRRGIAVRINGATYIASHNRPTNTTGISTMSIATGYYFSAGDYVELMAYQDSGGSLNVEAVGNYSPEFWAMKVG